MLDNEKIKLLRSALANQPSVLAKDKYFNSAVLVPLLFINDECHFLFEKRAGNIRQGGEVSFPGGEIDTQHDNNFKDTAIRETTEELGTAADQVEIIGGMGTLIAPMGITVDPYVGILNISSIEDLNIDTREVEKIFTIPVSFFLENKPDTYYINVRAHPYEDDEDGNKIELLPVKKLGLPNRYADPWRKARHRVFVYNTPGEIVWGITAEIVYEFCKLIIDSEIC
jgi:8-oxo-dGTP pyrophosphatase MutT (NUDIX family)